MILVKTDVIWYDDEYLWMSTMWRWRCHDDDKCWTLDDHTTNPSKKQTRLTQDDWWHILMIIW